MMEKQIEIPELYINRKVVKESANCITRSLLITMRKEREERTRLVF